MALMNVNTAGALGSDSGYLTIGSGARLQGNWSARRAYNRSEPLEDDGGCSLPPSYAMTFRRRCAASLSGCSAPERTRPYPFLLAPWGGLNLNECMRPSWEMQIAAPKQAGGNNSHGQRRAVTYGDVNIAAQGKG